MGTGSRALGSSFGSEISSQRGVGRKQRIYEVSCMVFDEAILDTFASGMESLYNEDLKVCGQVDSLWVDLQNDGALVMADWKRSRALLTCDEAELERQSLGKRGNFCCSHLYDTAWSHYHVQQTLYAYLLSSKYSIRVQRVLLVQLHPHVCGSDFNEAP